MEVGFSASPTSGVAPLSVNLTNESTGDYDICTWDFGDDSRITTCGNPSYDYTAAGSYTPTLTVSGPGGTDTEIKAGYITVEPPEDYVLDVRTVGEGAVTKDPDQGTYVHG